MLLLSCLLLIGCSKKMYQPIEVQTKIVEKEILVRDTVEVEVPVEVIKEVVPQMDTSVVETSIAKATAYVDTTTRTINHKIENKPVKLEKEIVYKDKIVEVEKITEVPVEVEVPKRDKLFWLSIGINLLVIVWILRKIGIIRL